jgi:uncharacterized membrane protein
MAETGHDPNYLPVHRSEALSDGIFAVAMTLLVIELKLPDAASIHSSDELLVALAGLLPKALAWFISFFVLAFFWVGHHRVFAYVRKADARLVWLNLAQLAAVSLMPFSCALIGEQGGYLPAQIVYSSNMALLAVLALLISRHVQRTPGLAPTPMPLARYRSARLRIVGLIVISFVAVLIGWLGPWPGSGNMAFALMGIVNPVSRALERRALAAEGRAAELDSAGSSAP